MRDVEGTAVLADGAVLGMTPAYCTGISHPANGTMRAPERDVVGMEGRPAQRFTRLMLTGCPSVPDRVFR